MSIAVGRLESRKVHHVSHFVLAQAFGKLTRILDIEGLRYESLTIDVVKNSFGSVRVDSAASCNNSGRRVAKDPFGGFGTDAAIAAGDQNGRVFVSHDVGSHAED